MSKKLSLNTHDIYALVTEISKFIGYRVLNVYDINSQTTCIKFNDSESIKKYLLIESSAKFYFLESFNIINDMPSSFSSKLRKHIKNKRLESIKQINMDRVIDIQFGTQELAYHLICEFYASGNIILTDCNYKILTLIHPYTYDKKSENKIKVSVGEIYPFNHATNKIELNLDSVKIYIEDGFKKVDKKIKIKQFITKLPIVFYSPNVLEHSLIKSEINPSEKIDSKSDIFSIFTDDKIIKFIDWINEMYTIKNFSGYIFDGNVIPYMYEQYKNIACEEYDSFNNALTKYYSQVQPLETKEKIKEKEKEVRLSKQEKVLYNIEQQIKGMSDKISKIDDSIENISYDMNSIQFFLKEVKKNENSNESICILERIQHKNEVKFKFNGFEYTFDYTKSAYDNLSILYNKKKGVCDKLKKAEIILEETQKSTKKNNREIVNHDTNKDMEKYDIKGQIKENWFEQFNWFITSDNLLVISGKTADQNEQIVKKYMDDKDIYIHSEIFGSGSCVIKNKNMVDIVEEAPKSVMESAEFLISHTKAWKNGIPDKAYWVRPNQVSKTAESGEFLTKGSFMVRGQKHYINVDKLELGFGILYKIKGKDELQREVKIEDEVEYAIPVMGTYSAMLKYKYKVKVIPGNQKIKKVIIDVINSFIKKSNLIEKLAIKKIKNDSIQKVLVTGVKFFI